MTKLFDYIHHKGCRAMDRRAAAADAGWADRYKARRIKPGVVLGTEGPGGLDGLFDDLDKAQRHRTWWHTAALHIHWKMEKYGVRPTARRIEAFWQRGKRGWSDRDTWNLDSYLSTVIRDAVRHQNEHKHGWPGEVNGVATFEEWGEILTEISDGMQAHLDIVDNLKDDDPELLRKRERAFELMAKHWGAMWD